MQYYKIPVSYSVCGEIEVEANSLEEALEYAKDNVRDLKLPDEPQYIEDSYKINDDIDLLRSINGNE